MQICARGAADLTRRLGYAEPVLPGKSETSHSRLRWRRRGGSATGKKAGNHLVGSPLLIDLHELSAFLLNGINMLRNIATNVMTISGSFTFHDLDLTIKVLRLSETQTHTHLNYSPDLRKHTFITPQWQMILFNSLPWLSTYKDQAV